MKIIMKYDGVLQPRYPAQKHPSLFLLNATHSNYKKISNVLVASFPAATCSLRSMN